MKPCEHASWKILCEVCPETFSFRDICNREVGSDIFQWCFGHNDNYCHFDLCSSGAGTKAQRYALWYSVRRIREAFVSMTRAASSYCMS